ncbi:MAG: hypothetical protein FJ088_01525 [Deltaproteobacteria bacterium]|nr:hypothetical protein [Deltaproteobacteria bacterium]
MKCDSIRIIREIFLGERETAPEGFLNHIKECEMCRNEFEALCAVEAEFESFAGVKGEVTAVERAFIPAFDEVIRRMEEGDKPASWKGFLSRLSRKGFRSYLLKREVLAMAAMLVLAVGLVVSVYFNIAKDEGLRHRGIMPRPHLEFFCVDLAPGGKRVIRESSIFSDAPSCRLSEELLITYLNPDERLRFFNAVAVSESGEVVWYYPNPQIGSSFEIAETDRLEPLETTIRLSVNHKPGIYKIYSFFCEERIEFEIFRDFVLKYKTKIEGKEINLADCVKDEDSLGLKEKFEVKSSSRHCASPVSCRSRPEPKVFPAPARSRGSIFLSYRARKALIRPRRSSGTRTMTPRYFTSFSGRSRRRYRCFRSSTTRARAFSRRRRRRRGRRS